MSFVNTTERGALPPLLEEVTFDVDKAEGWYLFGAYGKLYTGEKRTDFIVDSIFHVYCL